MKRIFEYDTETLSKTEVDTVLSVNREEQEATESDITSIEDEDFTEEREKEENIEMSPIIPQDLIQKFMSRVEKGSENQTRVQLSRTPDPMAPIMGSHY